MLRRLTLIVLSFAVAGAVYAQLAPNAPPDKPFEYSDAQVAILHQAIAPYVAQGQSTYPQARARYLSGLPDGESFYVWTVLHEPPNREESAFIRVTTIEGGIVTGTLSTQMRLLQGYHYGQAMHLPEKDVLDWLIARPDGTEEGNVVGKFMDNYHPSDSALTSASAFKEKCAVIVKTAAGGQAFVALQSLHVGTLGSQDGPFRLPADAPSGVAAVECGRESLVPLPYDYRVVAARYPFAITVSDENKMGILEVENGQLQFRMVKGEMTELGQKKVQVFLDQAQPLYSEETKPKSK